MKQYLKPKITVDNFDEKDCIMASAFISDVFGGNDNSMW